MTRESTRALAREQRLRLEHERVHVPVAHPARDDAVVRDYAKAAARRIPGEGPLGDEVRSAHVAGEERGDDPQLATLSCVGDGHQVREGTVAHCRRLWLEVLPQQEETDDLTAGIANPREVAIDLTRVETPPPPHGARGGPVIDTDVE